MHYYYFVRLWDGIQCQFINITAKMSVSYQPIMWVALVAHTTDSSQHNPVNYIMFPPLHITTVE